MYNSFRKVSARRGNDFVHIQQVSSKTYELPIKHVSFCFADLGSISSEEAFPLTTCCSTILYALVGSMLVDAGRTYPARKLDKASQRLHASAYCTPMQTCFGGLRRAEAESCQRTKTCGFFLAHIYTYLSSILVDTPHNEQVIALALALLSVKWVSTFSESKGQHTPIILWSCPD